MAPVTMATEREKLHMEDALEAESVKEKKYAYYSRTAEDRDLQRLFADLAKESAGHRHELEELMRHTGLSIQPH